MLRAALLLALAGAAGGLPARRDARTDEALEPPHRGAAASARSPHRRASRRAPRLLGRVRRSLERRAPKELIAADRNAEIVELARTLEGWAQLHEAGLDVHEADALGYTGSAAAPTVGAANEAELSFVHDRGRESAWFANHYVRAIAPPRADPAALWSVCGEALFGHAMEGHLFGPFIKNEHRRAAARAAAAIAHAAPISRRPPHQPRAAAELAVGATTGLEVGLPIHRRADRPAHRVRVRDGEG